MKTKKGFTLVEALVCILILSAVGMSTTYIVSGYLKNTYARDVQMKVVLQNMDTTERFKKEVSTLDEFYDFIGTLESGTIKVIAVGVGEVVLSKNADGSITVAKTGLDESQSLNEALRSDQYNLFRIIVAGKINGSIPPNTQLTAVTYLRR